MRIAILSRRPSLYSTSRLKEAGTTLSHAIRTGADGGKAAGETGES